MRDHKLWLIEVQLAQTVIGLSSAGPQNAMFNAIGSKQIVGSQDVDSICSKSWGK